MRGTKHHANPITHTHTGAFALSLSPLQGSLGVLGRGRGVAAAFVPTDIAGLRLWLKADAGLYQDSAGTTPATADSHPVGYWADQSGLGNHALQVTAARRPVRGSTSGVPYVELDGIDDWLAGALGALSAPLSIFMVVHFDELNQPSGNFDYVLSLGAVAANTFLSISRWNGGDANANKYYCYNGSAVFYGPVLTGQAWMALSVIHRTSAPRHNITVNGTAQSVADYGTNIATNGAYALGIFPGSFNHLKGKLREVLIYSGDVGASNEAAILSYLNTRWIIY